jgi:hypothetical protein
MNGRGLGAFLFETVRYLIRCITDKGHRVTNSHRALPNENLSYQSPSGRRYLYNRFVGLQLKEGFVLFYGVALLLQPLHQPGTIHG